MPVLLDVLYGLAGLAYLPFLAYAVLTQRKYRSGWGERFGRVPRRGGWRALATVTIGESPGRHGTRGKPGDLSIETNASTAFRPAAAVRPCVWVHAVSLGEVNATRTLIAELQRRLPEHEIVLSATTQTGADAARRLYPEIVSFRYPLDFSWVVRRTLDRIQPDIVLLMELEVWPNLLAMARRRGIPVCIVNGRITQERSMRRFRLPVVRSLARWMFSRVAWIAAQDETYAVRFRELGSDRVFVVGTMKYDTALSDDVDAAASAASQVALAPNAMAQPEHSRSNPHAIPKLLAGASALAAAMSLDAAAPILVAGSTGPGEEEILRDAWSLLLARYPSLQLVIVPRKPERFNEVARLIEGRGFDCIRRSQRLDSFKPAGPEMPGARQTARAAEAIAGTAAPREGQTVHLGDTMGELRNFYSLATVVFVGRSLVPMGGSDVMEVAALGKPIVAGPHMENFADAVDKLSRAGAMKTVSGAASLVQAVEPWLSDPSAAIAAGRAGRETVLSNTGATRRTVDLVVATLAKRC